MTLDQQIRDAERSGWTLKERVGNQKAIMVKKGKGSWRVHLALLVTTFGIGNFLYLIYSRLFNKQKTVIE